MIKDFFFFILDYLIRPHIHSDNSNSDLFLLILIQWSRHNKNINI